MLFERLELENFMGWSKFALDLSAYKGVVAILGAVESDTAHSNGTGKSSLLNAINLALYVSVVGDNLDGMIRQGSDFFKVTLRLEHRGVHYEIVRRKKLGSPQKLTFKDLTNKVTMSISPEEFLGTSEIIWENTVYSAQRKLSAFVDETPAKRKDILTEMFGLDIYLGLEDRSRKLAAKAENGMGETERDIARLTADIENCSPAEDITELDTDLAAHNSDIANLESDITDIDAEVAELRARVAHAQQEREESLRAERKLGELRQLHANTKLAGESAISNNMSSLAKLDIQLQSPPDPKLAVSIQVDLEYAHNARGTLSTLNKKISDLERQAGELHANYAQQLNQARSLRAQIDSIPEGKCPTCGTDMTEEHTAAYRLELQSTLEKHVSLAAENSEALTAISGSLESARMDADKWEILADSASALSDKLIAAKQAESQYENIVERAEALRISVQDATKKLDLDLAKLSADITELSQVISENSKNSPETYGESETELDKLRATRSLLASKLLHARDEVSALISRKSRAQYIAERTVTLKQELETAKTEYYGLKLERDTYSELVRAFGPAGIPALVLDNCLLELQQYLDHYMDILSDGKIRINFRTTKTNQTTAKISETLQITVSDSSGERDISLYSGGETVRVYLAIRLALAKLLYLKSGETPGVLIIDEVADLDDAGLLALRDLLKKIEPEFNQIFLVSHIPDLKDAFNSTLILQRDVEGNLITTTA